MRICTQRAANTARPSPNRPTPKSNVTPGLRRTCGVKHLHRQLVLPLKVHAHLLSDVHAELVIPAVQRRDACAELVPRACAATYLPAARRPSIGRNGPS